METTYKVPYTTVLAISPHTNADKLELATVYGFQVIVQKGRYKPGDKIVYIPIDSILPPKIENVLFPADSKIKLSKSRVRQIRIRGLASQGMVVDPSEVASILNLDRLAVETDLQLILEVKKYEPPETFIGKTGTPKSRDPKKANPHFHKYNGVENIKWFPNLFEEGERAVIQEKLHGTNCRAGLLPFNANSLWKKIKRFFGLAPKYEKCYGSNNVDISSKGNHGGYYGEDVYGKTLNAINVFDKLKPGETVYGEIIGPGIQKNYEYGLKELRFVLFDVKILKHDGSQEWLNPDDVKKFAKERGFEMAPVIYKGPFNLAFIKVLSTGNSVYCPAQKNREGVVIKSQYAYNNQGNKKALKLINEAYLDDKTNTDYH